MKLSFLDQLRKKPAETNIEPQGEFIPVVETEPFNERSRRGQGLDAVLKEVIRAREASLANRASPNNLRVAAEAVFHVLDREYNIDQDTLQLRDIGYRDEVAITLRDRQFTYLQMLKTAIAAEANGRATKSNLETAVWSFIQNINRAFERDYQMSPPTKALLGSQ